MQKTTTALATPLREQLDRLAAFEPSELPVLSVYLDMAADEQGRVHACCKARGGDGLPARDKRCGYPS